LCRGVSTLVAVVAWFDELAEFLRIPSISADPAHSEDVRKAGEWVCAFLRGAGGQCELIEVNGQPLAIGEVPASTNPDTAPTVLCYGHFDVQPPDPLELWDSPPFEPEIRGEHIYARGVADDKGQLYMLLSAARELAVKGELPVNLRFTCDGEEETGGHSIIDFLQAEEAGADAAVIFDSGMIRRDLPAFDIAMRGIAYFHVKLRTGQRDLHSGLFGGAALNAVHALVKMLEAVIPRNGRVPEPLRTGVLAPTAQELEDWGKLPDGAGELAGAGAHPADTEAAAEFYLRTFAEPAVDINGVHAGSPDLVKTVLPVEAVANVSIRLAPGQQLDEVAQAMERLLREAAPAGTELELELQSASPPGMVSPDAKALRLGLDAFERTVGVRPVLIRSGGTLPIVAVLGEKGIPTIITGFTIPGANMHSPNENLLVEYVSLGITTAAALFQEFASL
jgi:acetylornithine deacetylase/succinyl-diaminopimelate desuccinylase-like protein